MSKAIIKKITKICAGILTFSASLAAAYFLTPVRVKKLVLEDNHANQGSILPTHFQNFINTFSNDSGISSTQDDVRERHYYGLQAEFDDFSVSFKTSEEGKDNTIKLDGDINFLMRGLHDISFNLNVDVDYNSRLLPLEVGYVDETLYFGLKDLRMKLSSTTIDELKGNEEDGSDGLIYELFMASLEDGGLNFDFDRFIQEKYNGLINGLISSIDLSNMASFKIGQLDEGEDGIALNVDEHEIKDGWKFDIGLDVNMEGMLVNASATIYTDDDYHMSRIELGDIKFNDFTINVSGGINISCVKDLAVLAPTDPNYPRYNADYEYVEIINYRGWLRRLANFLSEEEQKMSFEFALDLDTEETKVGRLEGSFNADFSELIDLSSYQRETQDVQGKVNLDALSESVNKVELSADITVLGKDNSEYGNFLFKYKNGEGYLALNAFEDKASMRVKLDTETVNYLLSEVPNMVSSLGNGDSLASMLDLLTGSSVIDGIKEGDYSVILDVLKTLKNDNDKISLTLDLSTLGLGENASIDATIDSRMENHLLDIELNDLSLGSLSLNASLNTSEYKEVVISGNEEDYDSLSFVPGVINQVSAILDSKQAGFEISGSLLDDDNLGIRLSGSGEFDYGNKYGFGELTIDQYKYKNKGIWYSHKLNIDVDNQNTDLSKNNAFFVYGDISSNDVIKGKTDLQSVADLIDVVKTFIDDSKDDDRFSKFIAPIMEMLSLGGINEILNEKDYFKLIKNDFIKSIDRTNDNLDIVLGGTLLGLGSDIHISVDIKDDKINSLSVVDLAISEGKKLNITIAIKDFDENMNRPLKNISTSSFMDLSSISLLLKFGINTTKNNYYHLTANVDLSALAIINFDIDVEVYIVVRGEYVKIYGIIPDAKLSTIAQDYVPAYTTSIVSEFTFETYDENDENRTNGVGGYFHIKTTMKTWFSTNIKHYKTTSKNLIDSDNIMTYLLNDLLLIRSSITDKIGNISSSNDASEKEPGNFTNLFTDTGFNYNEEKNRWDIGINLNEISGIDALRDLELSLYGDSNERFKRLIANMSIKASLVTIKVSLDVTLEEVDPSVDDWSSDVESSFSKINSVSFSNSYLNDPQKYLTK